MPRRHSIEEPSLPGQAFSGRKEREACGFGLGYRSPETEDTRCFFDCGGQTNPDHHTPSPSLQCLWARNHLSFHDKGRSRKESRSNCTPRTPWLWRSSQGAGSANFSLLAGSTSGVRRKGVIGSGAPSHSPTSPATCSCRGGADASRAEVQELPSSCVQSASNSSTMDQSSAFLPKLSVFCNKLAQLPPANSQLCGHNWTFADPKTSHSGQASPDSGRAASHLQSTEPRAGLNQTTVRGPRQRGRLVRTLRPTSRGISQEVRYGDFRSIQAPRCHATHHSRETRTGQPAPGNVPKARPALLSVAKATEWLKLQFCKGPETPPS